MAALDKIRDEISEKISVREFLSQWDDDVYKLCASTVPSLTECIVDAMSMSTDNIRELESVCGLDKLKPQDDYQPDRWSLLEEIPPDLDLMCVRFQKQELERRMNRYHRIAVRRKFKYKRDDQNLAYHANLDQKRSVPDECRVIYPDVLLQVHIHRPMKAKRKRKGQVDVAGKPEQLIQTACVLVLGRQKLVALRDAIRCTYDYTVPGDLSGNPDAGALNPTKDIFKSGFFFIEGTFYNDMREADSRDYSKVIVDWANEPGRNVGPYTTEKMEDVTFLDLTLRLGEPYLYMHQGDCEHLIVFSDIRLLTANDPQDVRDYPFLLRKHRRHRTLCRVCDVQTARWVTYGSTTSPENPCFFCDQCFRFLHYDQDDKKIGNFEAYKFFDHHAII